MAKYPPFASLPCSLPTALEAMGERWSFLILKGAFAGICHFEEFQSALGIARNILSNRLARLVDKGIMTRETLQCDRRKVEYRLTEKGKALVPVMIALRQWGEKWECNMPILPVLVDARDRQPIRQVGLYSHDGRELRLEDIDWYIPEGCHCVGTEPAVLEEDEAVTA